MEIDIRNVKIGNWCEQYAQCVHIAETYALHKSPCSIRRQPITRIDSCHGAEHQLFARKYCSFHSEYCCDHFNWPDKKGFCLCIYNTRCLALKPVPHNKRFFFFCRVNAWENKARGMRYQLISSFGFYLCTLPTFQFPI